MTDRVPDQVVESLAQPLAIAVNRKAVVRLGAQRGLPGESRCLGSVARELRHIDALDAHRCRGGSGEEALDALESGARKLEQSPPANRVRRRSTRR